MRTIRPADLRVRLKSILDQVSEDGETVFVSRRRSVDNDTNYNVVIISEDEYNLMRKAYENKAYLTKLDRSDQELQQGKIITKSIQELEDLAR